GAPSCGAAADPRGAARRRTRCRGRWRAGRAGAGPPRGSPETGRLPGMRWASPVVLVAVTAMACGAPAPAPTAPPPPAPDPELPSRLVEDVSGDGALAHLAELQRIADSSGGNPALGTPGYHASVVYVAGVLRNAGYDVQTPEFSARRFEVQREELTVGGEAVEVSALGFSPTTPEEGVTGPLSAMAGEGCDPADAAGVAPGRWPSSGAARARSP